ncbi:MAG: hypothetical protein U0105_15675 [Candidatus Obscuribacterales bacterium]
MLKASETLVGLKVVGNFVCKAEIADGTYSRIFLAENQNDGTRVAVKIAKELDRPTTVKSQFQTRTHAITEGAVITVHPDTALVLSLQNRSMQYGYYGCYPWISHYEVRQGLPMYPMDVIEAPTIRELLNRAELVPVSSFVQLFGLLSKQQSRNASEYHGDLKPEHIFIGDQAPRLIDPGWFGPLHCDEGQGLDCALTTPIYYPLLKPDDLLAFGIVMWEVACKQHPMLMPEDSGSPAIGDSVRDWAKRYENVGQYFLSPIVNIRRPAEIVADMPPHLEQVLLKGLRLQIGANGLIETGPGFESFPEWQDAIQNLIDRGITHL